MMGLVVASGCTLYPVIRAALLAEFDYALLAKLRALTMFPEIDRSGVDLGFTARPMPEFERNDRAEFYQVWLHDGTVLSRSPSLGADSLERRHGPLSDPAFWDLTLPEDHPGRAVGVGFIPQATEIPDGEEPRDGTTRFAITVVFARNTVRLNRVLGLLLIGLVAGGGGLMALSAVVAAHGVRTGLRPLDQLADQVTHIDASSLDQTRFMTRDLPTEIQPVATQLNHLVDRLYTAFEREKRLNADIAHELYTPLAGLRSAAEVALRWPEDPEASAGLARNTVDSVAAMESVVRTLLALARCEAGTQVVQSEQIDLSRLVHEELDKVRPPSETEAPITERNIREQVFVDTDLTMLRTVLANLFRNAAAYTPTDGHIRCELSADDTQARLVLSNTARDIDENDVPRLFDPLWRKDTARAGADHAGLGLALAQSYTQTLGMTLQANLVEPDTLRLTLQIPVSTTT